MAQLVAEFPENVQVIYRHFPLPIHTHARSAAIASEAAALQGMFWEFHDALYEDQIALSGVDGKAAQEVYIGIAQTIGLDMAQFEADLENPELAQIVDNSLKEAENLALPGTPALLINNQMVGGGGLPGYDTLANFVENTVAINNMQDRQYPEPPPMTINVDSIYRATVKLEKGTEFVMELYPKSAPQTVNSFVFLVNEGWFDGVSFHRVIPGFVAQTGDPSGTGMGGPGYQLPNEIDPARSHNSAGVVAMANSGPDTNGSQWYITYGQTTQLDGAYTIFGQVIEGMEETVMNITPREPSTATGPGDRIESITIEEVAP